MLEVAVPEILLCLTAVQKASISSLPFQVEIIDGIGDWSGERGIFWKMANLREVLDGRYGFIHPFKMSYLLDRNQTEAAACFCNEVLPHMYSKPPRSKSWCYV